MSERESKDIARRWNREIEAEIRREAAAARRDRDGPWKVVAWTAVWLVWLALLVLLILYLKTLR